MTPRPRLNRHTDGAQHRNAQPMLSILDCMADPKVFARELRPGPNWQAWRAFLAALFGLTPSAEQLAIFRHCTQRQTPRQGGYSEAWLNCGPTSLSMKLRNRSL